MLNRNRTSRGVSLTVQVADRSYVGVSMMVAPESYMPENFQQRRGDDTIERIGTNVQVIRARVPIAYSKAILAPSRFTVVRLQSFSIIREIWIKSEDDIQTGDYLFDMKRSEYFVFLSKNEFVTENETIGIGGIAAKCNQTVEIYRTVATPTGAGGTTSRFVQIHNDVPVALEFIKGYLREENTGFYKMSSHRLFVPSHYGLSELDRIKVGEDYLLIDSVDRYSFPAVTHAAATMDRR